MGRRNLDELIKSKASYWAQRLTILAKAKAPKHIAPYISTKSVVGNGEVSLTLSIKKIDARNAEGHISNYGTLDAMAQEFGHPGAVITPRTGKYLAFKWDVATVGARYAPDGRILLEKVVKRPQPAYNEGQGYIRPAAEEWKQELMESKSTIKEAIRLDIMESLDKIGAKLRSVG